MSAARDTGPDETRCQGDVRAEDFHPDIFGEHSATIDNKWVALEVGTRFVYKGWTEEEAGERVPHRIVFTVTDMTKRISGVRARIGWDRDFSDGTLVESELIFLAQDVCGNVWHLGQYREVYDEEDGEFVGGRIWVAGMPEGSKAGIFMKTRPKMGAPAYSQGFSPPPNNWDDFGRVHKTGQRTCVPAGCYRNVLVIDEFEPTVKGAIQLKYYAPGVGSVSVGWRGRDPEKEVLRLVKRLKLNGAQMENARAKVLEHEERGYVYGRTPRAEPF